MSHRIRPACTGCGGEKLGPEYRIARQPVVLNYRCASSTAARAIPRRDLVLRQCLRCGLIFNAALDAALIPYDERYENRQCFSSAFQQHLASLADDLIARHKLRGRRILEVGCGKGDFLRLLCARGGATGMGYDTSYEGPASRDGGRVRFFRRYVTPAEVTMAFDLILCRHVVEHIGPIGAFLCELRAIAAAAGDPVTVIETPAFEWIAEHGCFWDVFHEHANYFPRPTLAQLAEAAGFRVARHRAVFGDQYQLLELRLGATTAPRPAKIAVRLPAFARCAEQSIRAFARRLPRGRNWAIWGAGAKGVCLVNRLREHPPRFVIDSNAAKQGGFIPGSAVPIIAPDDPRIAQLDTVFIANPSYRAEITAALRRVGFANTIRVL